MAAPTDSDLVDSIREWDDAVTEILGTADLATLSAKKVRKELEAKFEMDLSSRKKEIDDWLMAELAKKEANGASSSQDDPDESDGPDDADEPVAKKVKKKAESSDSESGDEAVARRLQEAENGGGRRSRGAAPKKAPKKERKKGPAAGTSVYSKECLLSEELSKVLGVNKMARKDVVSAMWKLFRERNLQDPKNKQFVNCDDDLFTVFKTKRFRAFGMMKYLKTHIKDAHFVADSDNL